MAGTIDTSMYPTQAQPPTNPLDLIGKYTGVKNALIQNQLGQQELQRSQISTQVSQGEQEVGRIIAKNTKDGKVNWLGVQSDAAQNPATAHPAIFPKVQAMVNDQLNAVSGGFGANKQPIAISQQQRNLKLGGGNQPPQDRSMAPAAPVPQEADGEQSQPQQTAPAQGGTPSIDTGLPPQYDAQLKSASSRIDQVQSDASNVGQSSAILHKIQDLAQTAPTGQMVGRIYQFLADKGVTAKNVTDQAEQLQEIKKYMHQAAIVNGVPDSDARLIAVESANPNSDQLPKTIQSLVPFLLATNEGKLLKQKYYNGQLGSDRDPNKELQAHTFWSQNYDPRLVELSLLPPEKRAEYVKNNPDVKALLPKYQALKKAGVFSGQGQ